jgi:hypothetical protein
MMKSSRMKWAGQEARRGRGKMHARFWWGNLKERDHLENLGVDGIVILKWVLKK